jgi:MFS family permease
MTTLPADRSYRSLLGVPSIGRLLLGMQLARVGQAMMSVTVVLFALSSYHSSWLAGMATFCGLFPGLVVSPIAGALLDRHGRIRLVVLDYLVALVSLVLMGVLALSGALPAGLLLLIASVASLTAPLSSTGLRSLIPLIVPARLWERVNALDSMGYVTATIIGPAIAASIVALWGGAVAFIIIGLSFGLAAVVIAGAPEPPAVIPPAKRLLIEAWQGLLYTWRNPTLRALGFSISVANLINGALMIVIPLLVLDRFHLNDTAVGLIFAIQGLAALASAAWFGRMDSRGRERKMLALPMIGTGIAGASLLVMSSPGSLVLVMALIGFFNGPLDIALFTLRQRRTDPAWMGRAFAVSMCFNYLGVPLGSAVAGAIGVRSIDAAIAFGAITSLFAGILAALLIPSSE